MRWLQMGLTIACLLMALGLGTAFSQYPVEVGGAAYVHGRVDCGMWVKARTEGRAALYEQNVIGTLNGLVLGTVIEFWRISETDTVTPDQAFLWIDKYCRDKPLSDVTQGAWRLFAERGHSQRLERLKRDFEYIESLKRDPERGR